MGSIFLALASLCYYASSVQLAGLPHPGEVSLIFVGFRHGYRNPSQFLKNDTSRNKTGWGWEGESQLTNIGKQQAYSLGKFLRNRYVRLLPRDFLAAEVLYNTQIISERTWIEGIDEILVQKLPYAFIEHCSILMVKVKATSSSAERCQMTLMTVLAGAFPPRRKAVWDRTLMWQPIPFDINDPLLRMYNVKCPTYTAAYQPISDDNLPESKEWLTKQKSLIQYVTQNTGLNGSLSDLADVADNVQSMIYNRARMPEWIQHPSLLDYDEESMVKDILKFVEAHQIQCAVDKPCARSMAGLWLNQILDILKQKINGKIPDRKVHFYAAHTETVLSLMKLMEMNVSETPTSAGFILEFKDNPPSVRTLFHEPRYENPKMRLAHVVRLPYCPYDDWCPIETFVQNVADDSFADWQEFCQLPKCPV